MSEPPVYLDEQPELDYGSLPERPHPRFKNMLDGVFRGDVLPFRYAGARNNKVAWFCWNRNTKIVSVIIGKHLRSGESIGRHRPHRRFAGPAWVRRLIKGRSGGDKRKSKHRRAIDRTKWELTENDILSMDISQRSLSFWIPIPYNKDARDGLTQVSLERLDCNIGYVPGNVVLAQLAINRLRSDSLPLDFAKYLHDHGFITKKHYIWLCDQINERLYQLKLQFPKEGKEKAA